MRSRILAAIALLFLAWTAAGIPPAQAANVPEDYSSYVLTSDVRTSDMGADSDLGEVPDIPTLQRKYAANGGYTWALRKIRRAFVMEPRLALTLAQSHGRYNFSDDDFATQVAKKVDELITTGNVADSPLADGQLMLYVSEGGWRDRHGVWHYETIHRRFHYDASQPALMAIARGWEFWVEYRDVRVRFTIPKPCGNLVVLTGYLMTYAGRVTQIPGGPSLTNLKITTQTVAWSTEGQKSSWHLTSNGSMAIGPPPSTFQRPINISVAGSSASASAPPMRGTATVSTAGAVSSSTATGVVGGPGGGSAAGAGNSGASTGGSATVTFGN